MKVWRRADLGNPSAEVIARSLGVHVRAVYRWKRTDKAPKAVMLAVFWATRWGRSAIDTATANEAAMHAGMADCLRRENDALRHELARLCTLGDFGSANAPLMRETGQRHVRAAKG